MQIQLSQFMQRLSWFFRRENWHAILTVLLLILVVILSGQCFLKSYDLKAAQNELATFRYDQKVLSFAKLFIGKVLKADGEVSFDDRLQLENAVRDINDKIIFDQWQKFVNSKTSLEAQIEVKNLLEMLISKISI